MKRFAACLLLAAAAGAEDAYVPLDTKSIDRTIVKEPVYGGEPMYALFVLNEEGTFRVWAALDVSSKDADLYDRLHVDLNGNGDLTEQGEAIAGKRFVSSKVEGMTFRTLFVDPPGPGFHSEFWVQYSVREEVPRFTWGLKWKDRTGIRGGFALTGDRPAPWKPTPAEAPVFRPSAKGPLSFSLEVEPVFARDVDNFAVVLVGHRASKDEPLAAFDENYLQLTADKLLVIVYATDEHGDEVRTVNRIRQHC